MTNVRTSMKFRHLGKTFLFNSRSNFKGYRVEFLKAILAAATDEKIASRVRAELAARKEAV